MQRFRIGQIVPSSNTTMETEIPAMLHARERIRPERFSFHSARMRMKKVTREELAAMDRESLRCARELADARVDVMGYACLVAIMSMGFGYHRESEGRLKATALENGCDTAVVSSAGALVDGLNELGAKKIAVITPYMKPLTKLVCDYIEEEGIEVTDAVSLEIADNLAVGARDPMAVLEHLKTLDVRRADAVVLSACVQMPVLEAIPDAEALLGGLPVTSAAACTVRSMLLSLGLEAVVPDAGAALASSAEHGRTLRAAS